MRWIARCLAGLTLVLPLCLGSASNARAAYGAGGSGTASALAFVMPSGAQPATRVSGSSVTLTWSAARFPNNQGVAGYVIRRFNAGTGSPATVGTNCSGTVASTTCTEQNVPSGSWTYTDSPVQGGWTGAQSAASAVVTIP